MLKYLTISICLFLISCTITITQTDTHGTASDVVDTDAKANADLKADVSLPVKGI